MLTQTNLLQVSPPFHRLSVPSRKAVAPVATELRNMSPGLPQALRGPAAQLPHLSSLQHYSKPTGTRKFICREPQLGPKMVEPDPTREQPSLAGPVPSPASRPSQGAFLTFSTPCHSILSTLKSKSTLLASQAMSHPTGLNSSAQAEGGAGYLWVKSVQGQESSRWKRSPQCSSRTTDTDVAKYRSW